MSVCLCEWVGMCVYVCNSDTQPIAKRLAINQNLEIWVALLRSTQKNTSNTRGRQQKWWNTSLSHIRPLSEKISPENKPETHLSTQPINYCLSSFCDNISSNNNKNLIGKVRTERLTSAVDTPPSASSPVNKFPSTCWLIPEGEKMEPLLDPITRWWEGGVRCWRGLSNNIGSATVPPQATEKATPTHYLADPKQIGSAEGTRSRRLLKGTGSRQINRPIW